MGNSLENPDGFSGLWKNPRHHFRRKILRWIECKRQNRAKFSGKVGKWEIHWKIQMDFLVHKKIHHTISDVKFYAESNENVRFGVSFQEKSKKAQNNSKFTHLRYKNYFVSRYWLRWLFSTFPNFIL